MMKSEDLSILGGELFLDTVEVEHLGLHGTEVWHKEVVNVLRLIFDPEIPVNIYDLGLVYKIETLKVGSVKIVMTLTSPNCPEAEILPQKVETEVKSLKNAKDVEVELSWDFFWTPDRLSEDVRLDLGFY